MLVLTRRLNEKIVLPSLNITIQIVDVQKGRVRIGIEAPANVAIVREELCAGRPTAAAVGVEAPK
jgi:carbon storage regulator CsrA